MRPIAIIGGACRFPGAASLEEYWRLLRDGKDAIRDVPANRWPSAARAGVGGDESGCSRSGGFLDDVYGFDAEFFRISRGEAPEIDPQQRLLLEVTWEALEDAGLADSRLDGARGGVYVGLSNYDHLRIHSGPRMSAHLTTGSAASIAANRLSFFLNLTGPSVVVDTACSSSLVAVHLACQSIAAGDCDFAICGGANLMLNADATFAFARAGMLASDGRCKTFDADADGYVRGEGAGIAVLKPLDEAEKDGDRILAVIRGSAVNQDGLSNGLTAPNQQAQESVLAAAWSRAGVSPREIQYCELHGTGTLLGDPIEAKALGNALARGGERAGRKVRVGSAKTNIGHLESAAGIAGMLKVALALRHRWLPPSLHFKNPNPHIPFGDLPIEVQTCSEAWVDATGAAENMAAFAGVSSFGFGGTNCHMVLESPAAGPKEGLDFNVPLPILPVSARSERALMESATNYRCFISETKEPLEAVLCAASVGRSHFAERLAIVAGTREGVLNGLNAILRGGNCPSVRRGTAPRRAPKLAFLFPGQGAQFAGMGLQLVNAFAEIRNTLAQCDGVFRAETGESLLDLLGETSGGLSIDNTRYTQPALFALEVAFARLLIGWGIRPALVLGHSLGEYSAACVAGAFSLDDGVKLTARRGRLMEKLELETGMLAVFENEEFVRLSLNGFPEKLEIASSNSSKNTVVSGSVTGLEAYSRHLRDAQVHSRRVKVSHGFHSAAVEPILDALEAEAGRITSAALEMEMVTSLSGESLPPGSRIAPRHWRRHAREPVRFSGSVATLAARRVTICLEAGPGRFLSSLVAPSSDGESIKCLSTLVEGDDPVRTLAESLAELYVSGGPIEWDAVYQGRRPAISLPNYPFQREQYRLPDNGILRPAPSCIDEARAESQTHPPSPAPARRESAASREDVLSRLLVLVSGLLRTKPESVDPTAPFLEMGADSILLLTAVRKIELEFGVSLSVRQFFEELKTIDAVADFIAARTADLLAEAGASPRTDSPGRAKPEMPGGALADVFARQLAIMERQLTLLERSAVPGEPDFRAAQRALASEKPNLPTAPPAASGPPAPSRVKKDIGGLSDQQEKHIRGLAEKFTKKTAGSRNFANRNRSRLADCRASAGFRFSTKEMLYPLVGSRAEGAYLYDLDDNRYIDITMGFGVHLFGHRPAFIEQALRRRIEAGLPLGPRCAEAAEAGALIAKLTGFDRVAFCNTGTEAVMTALRIARTNRRRSKVALFTNSYHGHFDGVLAHDAGGTIPEPLVPGVPDGMVRDLMLLEYGSEESLKRIESHADQLAAVLVEPVQSRRPDFQPGEFLKSLREITLRTGVILIFDEMITGFRIHPGGAQAWFGVKADMATYGKVVGGGMPIGVVAGRGNYLDAIDGGVWQYGDDSFPAAETTFFAGTFCQHPLAMAASVAALSEIVRQGPELQRSLNEKTDRLAARLNEEFSGLELSVANFGSLFRFSYTANLDIFFYHLAHRGIYVWEGRNCFLSAAHSDGDIDFVAEAVVEVATELAEAGFLPRNERARSSAGAPLGKRALGLTAAQKQLWVLSQVHEAGCAAYRIPLLLEMRGTIDPARMQRALQLTSNRHESLRSRFDPDGSRQWIEPAIEVELPFRDLSGDPPPLESFVAGRQAFDLTAAPLLRAELARIGPGRFWLFAEAHHSMIDGQSLQIVIREWLERYVELGRESQSNGTVHLPKSFADFVEWQDSQAGSEAWKGHRTFWLRTLDNAPHGIDLPEDHERPAMRTYLGGRQSRRAIAGTAPRVRAAAAKLGVTPFMLLFAAYSIWLRRLTGQGDLVIGIPYAGRDLAGGEEIVGYCTHLLPIRVSGAPGDGSAAALVRHVRSLLLEAFEHAEYPFAHLLKDLDISSRPDRPPLVSCTFNYDRVADLPNVDGIAVSVVSTPTTHAKFDLGANLTEEGDSLLIEMEFNADLFDGDSISGFLAQYLAILDQVLEAPSASVDSFTLITDDEQALLAAWNSTARTFPPAESVCDRIEESVRRYPDRAAVACEDAVLTYQELDVRAERLMLRLKEADASANSRVAVILPRTTDAVVAILAVLKSGCAYVFVEPGTPAKRVRTIFEEAGCSAVVTDRDRPSLDFFEGPVFEVSGRPLKKQTRMIAPIDKFDRALAYVVFTSGSSGRPKGVAVSHAALLNYVDGVIEALELRGAGSFATVSTFAADLGNTQLFAALWSGGNLRIISQSAALDAEAQANRFEIDPVDVLKIVPSHLEALLSVERPERILPKTHLILGGEACRPQLLRRLEALRPKCKIFNHYGPCETTVGVLTGEFRVGLGIATIPLARPLANVEVFVLDGSLQPVPAGVPGEVFVAGACLAEGYIGRPEWNWERFIVHRIGDSEKRLYRTGDRARRNRDGSIEILGRVDDQVKIRGFRVEPAEVARVLERHPGVVSVAVRPVERPGGSTGLRAFVVAGDSGPPSKEELRAFTAEHLPDFMVPADIVFLDALPLTPNGKLDRRALPAPGEGRGAPAMLPRSEREKLLASIWRKVLGGGIPGVHDHFFELGGDSIMAIQVASLLHRGGYRLHPGDLYRHPTIAAAAAKMERVDAEQEEMRAPDPQGPFGLTPIQRRFFERVPEAHRKHWNLSVRLAMESGVSAKDVQTAFSALVARHDALRLGFRRDGNEWLQEVGAPYEAPMRFLNRKEGQDTRVLTELQAALDLESGRLLQLAWIDGERPELLAIVHHLATDAVSWRILLEDLTLALEKIGSDATELGPMSASYRKWAASLTKAGRSADFRDAFEYWELSASVEGNGVPAEDGAERDRHTEGLAESVVRFLDETATAHLLHGLEVVRVDEILVAALASAFNGWSGESALLLELEGHGRDSMFETLDLSRSVGWFTNRYPVWIELDAAKGPGEVIKRVRERLRQVPDGGNSYGILRFLDSRAGEVLARGAAPQVSFNYLGQWDHAEFGGAFFKLADGPKGLERAADCPRLFAIEIDAMVTGGRLKTQWTFSPGLHRRSTIEALVEAFLKELRRLIDCLAHSAGDPIAPSDFPDAEIDEDQFEDLLDQLGLSEPILP